MAVKWNKTKFLGVRYREHATRKHGVRYDKCYSIRYKLDGKDKEEVVGWSSEGITAELASLKLSELRENARNGKGAKTLGEKKAQTILDEEKLKNAQAIRKESEITLTRYWEDIYKNYAKASKKISSFKSEEMHMRNWILPYLGNYELSQINLKSWDKLIHILNESTLSPRTKEYICGTLRRLLKHAKNRGLNIEIPSVKDIGIKKNLDNRRLRILNKEEARLILEKLGSLDIHTKNLTLFCMLTGCRLSEAVHIKWADINFEESFLRFVNTKNKDTRIFYFSDKIYSLLKSLEMGIPNEIIFKRNDGKTFFGNTEKSESPHYFVRAVKELGLNDGRDTRDRVSFHTIRHTVATNLAKVLDVRSLMDVMGWKVVAMAARYIHTQEETKKKAANYLASSWSDN